ncbi:AAA domain-containing protein [Thamnidium elegans]|nr:AAA domain-containing protein [Thamnidium elegans]
MDELTKFLDRFSVNQLAERSKEKTIIQKGKQSEVLLKEADVVFCTLNESGNALMGDETFDVVIIDEAGQATELDCWIALKKLFW